MFLLLRPTPAVSPGAQRFNVALPPGLRIDDALDAVRQPLALSRDGRQLAFVTRSAAGKKQIYVRPIDPVDAEPVPGTEGGDMPFFSPDGSAARLRVRGQVEARRRRRRHAGGHL